MYKIAGISNLLARSFLVFILCYLWIGFYIRGLFWVAVLSALVTAGVNALFHLYLRRRNAKTSLSKREKDAIVKIALQLKFQTRARTAQLLKSALVRLGREVRVCTRKVIVFPTARNATKIYDEAVDGAAPAGTAGGGEANLFLLFGKTVTADDVLAAVKMTNQNAKTVIAAVDFPREVVAFAKSLDTPITLLNVENVYTDILKPANIFPEIEISYKTKSRLTLARLKEMAFTRQKARRYVVMGCVILATSFIVRFNIYYVAVASVMFLFALVGYFCVSSKDAVL
jgi:hypothetical protein